MPLIHSSNPQAVSQNIRQLMQDGKPRKQAIAIALEIQREAKKKEK